MVKLPAGGGFATATTTAAAAALGGDTLLHLFCTVPVNVCVGAGVLAKSL